MLDATHLIESGGLLVIAAIIFAETGLLVGFFLPGDTLLLSAGVLAAQGKLPLLWTLLVVMLASILGNATGFQIGKHGGPKIFSKADGFLFRKEYVTRAEKFYEDHGGKTILLARFIPIVRTFAAVVAGVGNMNFGLFMTYNLIGGILWGGGVTLAGYWFGSRIPNIDHYILPVVLAASVLSFSPMLYHIGKALWEKQRKG
ncbi:MAG TPA: VTT domain-containing protein [Patescibacteria group bacterium]|nr:VTT domain-containing protein [Patescibacteria group bacterium]